MAKKKKKAEVNFTEQKKYQSSVKHSVIQTFANRVAFSLWRI